MRKNIVVGGCLALILAALAVVNVTRADEKQVPMCPVMGEAVNLAVSTETPEGPVYFCCPMCIKAYKTDSAKYTAQVAEQRKLLADRPKVQVKCPVMGEPVKADVTVEHDGKKVQLCCKRCLKKFGDNPTPYRSALANAYTYQTKCPVSGQAINPASFTKLVTGETVYFCGEQCSAKFLAEPAKYTPNLEAQGFSLDPAKVKAAPSDEGHEHDHGHEGHDHE